MKYLLSQLFILFFSVIILYYFSTVPNFIPYKIDGNLDWVKIGIVIFLIFLIIESFISLLIFLIEKFLVYGRKEFPDKLISLKWGIGISLCFIALLFLHLNHLITVFWAIVILVCFIFIIIIV